jgi:hypothetical protein
MNFQLQPRRAGNQLIIENAFAYGHQPDMASRPKSAISIPPSSIEGLNIRKFQLRSGFCGVEETPIDAAIFVEPSRTTLPALC